MTDARPGTETYWSDLSDAAADGGAEPDDGLVSVRERIEEELDGHIHAIAVTARRKETVYLLVTHSERKHGGRALNLTTVVVDLADGKVKPNRKNSMWLPCEMPALEALTKSAARTTTDVGSGKDRGRFLHGDDVEQLLAHRLKPDDYERPDGWGVTWGNGKGAPPEAFDLVERLAAANVETERFSRLAYGEKKPHDRAAEHPVGGLYGNYGVETLPNDPLIVIDVDSPEDAPVEALLDLDTYRVTSPHGGETRAHHYLVCPDKARVIEHFGTGAVKPGWGDVWLSGEYVVGPGSMLAKGCNKGEECDGRCGEPGGGRYEVVADRPIATIGAEALIDLLESSWSRPEREVEADQEAEADAPVPVEDVEPEPVAAECGACGAAIEDTAEADLRDLGDGPVYVCGGGCS